MTKTNHGTEIPPPEPALASCSECGKTKTKHILLLGHFYCYEFTARTSPDNAIAEFQQY